MNNIKDQENINQKVILLRLDLNVPLKNGPQKNEKNPPLVSKIKGQQNKKYSPWSYPDAAAAGPAAATSAAASAVCI